MGDDLRRALIGTQGGDDLPSDRLANRALASFDATNALSAMNRTLNGEGNVPGLQTVARREKLRKHSLMDFKI